MIYYGVILLLGVFSLLKQGRIEKRFSLLFSWVAILVVFLMGGLRQQVGADWPSYERLFESLGGMSDVFVAREEKLFVMLMFASKRAFASYSFFILLVFGLAFFSKVSVIRRYSMDVCLSLLVYMYTVFIIYDTNGLRYGLALSSFLLSIHSIINRNLGRFLMFSALACGFQLAALVVIPFYWLARVRLSNKVLGVLVVVGIVSSLPLGVAIEGELLHLLRARDWLEHYVIYLKDAGLGTDVSLVSVALLQRSVTLALALFFLKRTNERGDLQRLLVNGYAFSVVLFAMFSFSGEFATRVSFFYKAFEILLIPEIVSSQKGVAGRLLLLLFFTLSAVVAVGRLLSNPDGALLPYRNLLWR